MSDTNYPVLIVGSIALDTIETPGDRRANILGGSTTYALLAASRTTAVHVVGVVGEDFPGEYQKLYRQYATDLSDLQTRNGDTFRWGGRYAANMEDRETLFTELGVFADFNPMLSPVNQSVPYVFLANIHPALQQTVIEQTGDDATIVVDTMNLWINTTRPELERVLTLSDILLLNESEAELLTDLKDPDEAARELQAMGPEKVVIKLGRRGSILYGDGEPIRVGVFPVETVVDATGAGDTFGGGLIAALAAGEDDREALINGTALASLCVEGFGIDALEAATTEEIDHRKAAIRSRLIS